MGPVDLFASSGGAVNALALVAAHPEQVRTLVAHEPPLASILPDREGALAVYRGDPRHVRAARVRAGMAQFIVVVSHKGPFDAEFAGQPAPDPAMFGMPTEDDGTRTDAAARARTSSRARTTSPTSTRCARRRPRIVLAAGVESEGEMAHRGAEAVAERLGTTPCRFPSGHGGFLGGEYGQAGEPDAFAAKLREVLIEA